MIAVNRPRASAICSRAEIPRYPARQQRTPQEPVADEPRVQPQQSSRKRARARWRRQNPCRCRSRRRPRRDCRAVRARAERLGDRRRAAEWITPASDSTAWQKARACATLESPETRSASLSPWASVADSKSFSMPLWTKYMRDSRLMIVSPSTLKRKWPGSMMPACTGPTVIS